MRDFLSRAGRARVAGWARPHKESEAILAFAAFGPIDFISAASNCLGFVTFCFARRFCEKAD
jgi:hypothetical protein